MAFQTPQAQFIARIAERGAALALYPDFNGGPIQVIAAVDVRPIERNGRLEAIMLYEPFAAYTGGVHRLTFDEARIVHIKSIEFIQGSRTTAVLEQPDPIDYPEVWATLDAWYVHLEDPENRRRHEQAIQQEYG